MLFQYNPADINWFQSHTGNYVKSIVTSTRAYTHTHTRTHTNYKNRLVFLTSLEVYYRESAHTHVQTNTHTSSIFTHTHTHTNYKNRLVFFTLAQTNTHTSIIFIQPKSSILVKADFINKVYNFFIKIFLFQF